MANDQFKEPQADWLPLLEAIFKFSELIDRSVIGPDQAACEQDLDSLSLAQLERVLTEKSGVDGAEINSITRSFAFLIDSSSSDPSRIEGAPWELINEIDRGLREIKQHWSYSRYPTMTIAAPRWPPADLIRFRKVSEGQVYAFRDAISAVWRDVMLKRFDRAVSERRITLYARIEAAIAVYQQIPPETWPILEVRNWWHGAAVGPGGMGYLSIHVCPPQTAARVSQPAANSRQPARARAKQALDALYGDKIPAFSELPNNHLCHEVSKWLKEKKILEVKPDTILRAAGRRS